jgi:hypothetical protein
MPAHFARNRKDIFHYVLFGHALGVPEALLSTNPYVPIGHPKSVSGVADFPGGDILVTLGRWRSDIPENDQVGSVLVQAGTLMHEIGHNLNLSHAGGMRAPNCVPNYPSIMNYLYQTRGLTAADNSAHVDYAYGRLTTTLIEGSLSETASLGAAPDYRIRYFGPVTAADPPDSAAKLHCDGTQIAAGEPPMLRLENTFIPFIDWDHNGDSTPGPVSSDVNYDGTTGALMPDFNDWASLNLQQVGIRPGVGELSLDVQLNDLSQSDPGSPDFGSPDFGSPDFGSPDFGSPDFGSPDFGSPDFGDVDFQTQILSTVDPPPHQSPDCPSCGLKVTNKIDRVTLSLTAPGTGQINNYHFYRKNADVPGSPFTFLKSAPGGAAVVTTDDTTAAFNVGYIYRATAVASSGTSTIESIPSNEANGIVKHLFVTSNVTKPFGAPIPSPLPVTITGLDVAALVPARDGVTCTTTATASSPIGTYPITCTGPAAVAPLGSTDLVDGITYLPGTLTITKANQTITFPPLPNKTYGDSDFTLSATASSGLTVTFTIAGNCTLVGAHTVHITGAGSCTITAHQAGDSNFNAAPDVSRTFSIAKANSVVTITSDSPDPSIVGSPVAVTFTVTPAGATGTVTVTESGTGSASCTATLPTLTCTLTPTVPGSKTLTATYSGDMNINGSSSAPAPHQVDWNVTLTAPKTPAKLGSAVPVNFQIKNAQGVAISDLSVVLLIESVFNGPASASGCVASVSGTHEIIYQSPDFSTGKSSLRFVSNQGYQFNWDTTSAQTNPTVTGMGCYTVLIYLNDRGLVNPRIVGPLQLN